MRVFFRSLFFLFITLISLSVCRGDDFFRVKNKIEENARFRLTYFYVEPSVKLSNVGHTSNIYVYDNLSEPDWVSDVGFDILVSAIIKDRLILQVREVPYWDLYYENKDLQTFNNQLDVLAHTYLGHLNLQFLYRNNNINSRPTPEFGARTRNVSELISLSADYGDQKQFFLNLYAEREMFRYEDEVYASTANLKELMDRDENRVGVALNKRIFTSTMLFANYEYFEDKFVVSSERDGVGSRLTGGLRFPEVGPLTGSVRYGIQSYRPNNPEYRDFLKPFGDGRATLSFLYRFKLHLLYQTRSIYSIWSLDYFYVDQSIQGTLECYLTRSIKAGYRYKTGTLDYYKMDSDSLERTDRLYDHSVFMGLRIMGDTSIGIEYHRYRVESPGGGFDRSYNFIGGYITYDF